MRHKTYLWIILGFVLFTLALGAGYFVSNPLAQSGDEAAAKPFSQPAMPADILRDGGEAAVARALAWLLDRAPEALEPGVSPDTPTAAFNITILSQLLGTPLEPDLGGHVLMLEEVAEQMYRIDRAMFHITSNPAIRQVAGIRLGRCSLVPPNEPEFDEDDEALVMRWCARSGIAYLGRADIGHDADNKVVPFGACP